jgi:hypothetical protein
MNSKIQTLKIIKKTMILGINQNEEVKLVQVNHVYEQLHKPLEMSSKIEFANMCHDGSSLYNLLMYGTQAWMRWFMSHKKHFAGKVHQVWVFP